MPATEVTTLCIGGTHAAVHVREASEKPQETATPEIAQLTDAMLHDYEEKRPWLKEAFHAKGGPDILQAVRLFCQTVNFNRVRANLPSLNILELDDLVAQQAKSLASPLQLLCSWTVLVRIGVRKLQRELLGLIATLPMPPQGSIRLAQPADTVGKTHYVITHLLGEKFLCRGYSMHITRDGDWVLGGTDGNRWHKDLWLTPGIQSVDAILAAKRRKIEPRGRQANDKEASFVKKTLDETRSRLEKSRAVSGMRSEAFGAAHGARMDLENGAIMRAALDCVRAMIAQALSIREDQTLDEIAGRQGLSKSTLSQDPTQAGDEAAAFSQHLLRRDHANAGFRACGRFVIPQGYMVFAAQNVPTSIAPELRTEVAGAAGIAVNIAGLSAADCVQLKSSPAALSDVEDLTPLIDASGITTINGQALDSMEVITEEDGKEVLRYYVGGQEPQELPIAEFLRRAFVKFVPIVIRTKRRRMVPEDMQGSQNGVNFAMSFEDVCERFVPCKSQYSSKRSYQSNS
jgi:hypothetical protein